MSSPRTSSIVIFVSLMAERMPSSRSRALSAFGRPAKAMHFPPCGMALIRTSAACLPARGRLDRLRGHHADVMRDGKFVLTMCDRKSEGSFYRRLGCAGSEGDRSYELHPSFSFGAGVDDQRGVVGPPHD